MQIGGIVQNFLYFLDTRSRSAGYSAPTQQTRAGNPGKSRLGRHPVPAGSRPGKANSHH